MKQATEQEFLKWFYVNADFGPAHGEVLQHLKEKFEEKTKKKLPKGYEKEE